MPIEPREELIWLPRTLDPDDPNVEVCVHQFQFLITMIIATVALPGQNCLDLQGQRSMPVLDVQFSPLHDAIPAQQCRGQKPFWFSFFFSRFALLLYTAMCWCRCFSLPFGDGGNDDTHNDEGRAWEWIIINADTVSSEQWAIMHLLQYLFSHHLSWSVTNVGTSFIYHQRSRLAGNAFGV